MPYDQSALKYIGEFKGKMKVKIKPKEGELSDYAKDHIVKTNKKGKVTIAVPRAEAWDEKSKLFKDNPNIETITDKRGKTYFSGPGAMNPNAQSSAKAFKKARRRDRLARGVVGAIGGLMAGSTIGAGIMDRIKGR